MTSGATFPVLCEECVESLTSLANQYREATGEVDYGFIVVIKLKWLTICECHSRGSTFKALSGQTKHKTFSSVNLRKST